MAIRLLQSLFGHSFNVIVKDLSYDIERRLVEKGLASYSLIGGNTQTKKTVPDGLSEFEQNILSQKEAFDLLDSEFPVMASKTPTGVIRNSAGEVDVVYVQDGLPTIALLGDSLSAMCNYLITPTSVVRSSGVATVTLTSHGLSSGTKCAVFGIGSRFDTDDVSVTRVNANTFTYPSAGDDANAVVTATYSRILAKSWTTNNSWFQYANSKFKGALRLTGYYAHSSETTTQMLARIDAVAASNEPTVIYMGGSNDVVGSETTARIIANDAAIVKALVSAGKRVVIATIPALGIGHAQFATAAPKIKTINSARRALAKTYPSRLVALADVYSTVADNTQSDGRAVTTYLQTDKIHLQASGAKRIGELAMYPALAQLGHIAVETLTTAAFSENLWPIGQYAKVDGGTKSVLTNDLSPPLGCVAGVLTGFNVTASGGAGKVYIAPDSDGYGYLQVAKFTPSGAQTLTLQQESASALALTPGAEYRIGFRLKVFGVTPALSYLRCRVQTVVDAVTLVPGTPLHSQTSGASNVGEDSDLWLISEPFVMPVGTSTSFTIEVIAAFTGATTEHVVSVGRMTVDPA